MYFLSVLALCGLVGCGSSALPPPRQSAQEAFRAGLSALAGGDNATAEQQLKSAVDSGALPADDFCEALVSRGLALARLTRFEEAHASLDRAEQGTPDVARLLAARAAVLRRQGKTAEADRAFASAKQLNPQTKALDK
jgi:tetratricopeptide (TPR) repeat protein